MKDYGRKKHSNNYFGCEIHENMKFDYYCIDCKYDLCKKCASSEGQKNHVKTFIDLNDEIIYEKIKRINTIIDNIQNNLDKADSEKRQILNIIITIIYNYCEYICYNQYCNIIECEKYLEKFEEKINDIKMVEIIKITKYGELDCYENRLKSDLISSIKIIEQKNVDLSKLKYFNFKKLNVIQLINCNIENIKPLKEIKNQENVLELNLACNKIDDTKLENIINFKNLELLNFYDNKLKNFDSFEIFQSFKKLKTLYLGRNKFETKNYNKKYNFNDLNILGITECFNDKNANLISNIVCKNLSELYISRNDFTTINFMKNFESDKIKELWAINNKLFDISELRFLKFKKSLEILNLSNNQIKDLKWFANNIEQFPNLKELILINNPLSEESLNLINEIIAKTNFRLKIILEQRKVN